VESGKGGVVGRERAEGVGENGGGGRYGERGGGGG